VDFAKDAQWRAWNEEALTRFLDRRNNTGARYTASVALESNSISGLPTNICETWSQQNMHAQVPSTKWCNEDTKQGLFDTDFDTGLLFESCNQIVALEDNLVNDMWGLPMVSCDQDVGAASMNTLLTHDRTEDDPS
jgi:hypothetical protein